MRYLLEVAKYVAFSVIFEQLLFVGLLDGSLTFFFHMKLFLIGLSTLVLLFVVSVKGMIL